MRTPRVWSHRLLRLTGAALLGMGASVAFAAPAVADVPILTGTTRCDTNTGQWKVSWRVENSETDWEGEITEAEVDPAGTVLTGIEVGSVVPKKGHGAALFGEQAMPATAAAARLKVTVFWDKEPPAVDVTNSAEATVHVKGVCAIGTVEPRARAILLCEGGATVTLGNGPGATIANWFTVKATNGFERTVSVPPGTETTVVFTAGRDDFFHVIDETAGRVLIAGSTFASNACGELPVTGVRTAAGIGLALGLLAVGGVLLLVVRRRQVRFVA